MVHWIWIPIMFIVGALMGVFLMALNVASKLGGYEE